MTFDNEDELRKIQAVYPRAKLVLRILPDDSRSKVPLGDKFGCPNHSVGKLLLCARALGLDVIGVSFHIGSGCESASAFQAAITQARQVFDHAGALGFGMKILDIGGGFPGGAAPLSLSSRRVPAELLSPASCDAATVSPCSTPTIQDFASVINHALEESFPREMNVQVIAEPGRYMVTSAVTLAANIIARRTMVSDDGEDTNCMYYVNDGVYGSLSPVFWEGFPVQGSPVQTRAANIPRFSSSLWGPTCDVLDCIQRDVRLPMMDVGEWMYFHDLGA